jgi:hypothetical protein
LDKQKNVIKNTMTRTTRWNNWDAQNFLFPYLLFPFCIKHKETLWGSSLWGFFLDLMFLLNNTYLLIYRSCSFGLGLDELFIIIEPIIFPYFLSKLTSYIIYNFNYLNYFDYFYKTFCFCINKVATAIQLWLYYYWELLTKDWLFNGLATYT